MRPGNSNKQRMRGRNPNNNRRGPNPLTRAYESNGPDVKVRGTATNIAEKYVQLARDAHSAGDPVLVESYLQHAEHYYRLIAAAQPQQPGHSQRDDEYDEDAEDFENTTADRFTFRSPQSFQVSNGNGYHGGNQPGEGEAGDGENRQEGRQEGRHEGRQENRQDNRQDNRQEGRHEGRNDQPRQPFNRDRDRGYDRDGNQGERGQGERGQGERGQDRMHQERGPQERGERFGQDRGPNRNDRNDRRFGRRDRGPRFNEGGYAPPAPAALDAEQPIIPDDVAPGLPSFITAPVRIAAVEPVAPYPVAVAESTGEGVMADEADSALRPRRRRGRPPRKEEAGEGAPSVEAPATDRPEPVSE
jgi:hypothetical protein